MTANATVYVARALGIASIRATARLAKVTSVAGDVLAVIELAGGVRVTIGQMPEAELDAHLAGVRSFVVQRCTLEDDGFLARLPDIVQVLGLVIEPGLDVAGKTTELIQAIARSGHGFSFDGVRFRDRDGQVLAVKTVGTADVDPEHATVELGDPGTGPPTAARVLARAWALSAVAVRAFLEDEPSADASELAARIRRWLGDAAIDGELERDERELIDTPVGDLSRERKADGTWRSEGLAVLGWALGVSELPDFATPVDAGAVAAAVGFLAPERPVSVSPPRLRSPAELDWMARRLTGLHWRLSERWTSGAKVDFRSFSRNAWFGGFDLIGLPLADDDLAIDGVAITLAARDRVKQCHSIAVERHQAIAWLRGLHPVYSKVDTAT